MYDLKTDAFKELSGPGVALGVDSECIYDDNRNVSFSNNQIIFLSTDGVWEARDKNGKMFSKKPIRRIIRDNASSDATTILNGIFNSVEDFVGKTKIDDDITAVVIKVQ